MSSRLTLRFLCGALLVMTLVDVPVAASLETGQVIGTFALFVVLASLARLALPQRARQGAVDHGRDPERKGRLLVGQIR
jgi:hypothetical protein